MRFARPGFQIGLSCPLVIREELVHTGGNPCRLAYVSDIHLRRGRSQRLAGQVIDALKQARPDLILLGGDLVDQASELDELREMLARMLDLAPVFAIPGNHDCSVGEERVKGAVLDSGALWLAGRTEQFKHQERNLSISGPGAKPIPDADFSVLCAHNPSVWKSARKGGFDLVLAGHLHGCQAVLFEAGGKLFPGALFYPYNYIRKVSNGTLLAVSMGCSDLIPIRWGCPREIILCIV
jgi:predicted MPP superfamily phosphohydrolase